MFRLSDAIILISLKFIKMKMLKIKSTKTQKNLLFNEIAASQLNLIKGGGYIVIEDNVLLRVP